MTRRTPLRVIECAEELAASIYRMTQGLPGNERFSLTTQMRRAVVSIGSDLAEGSARSSDVDFARFVVIADGSAAELSFQLRICQRLGYLDHAAYTRLSGELNSLRKQMRSLRSRLRGQEPTANGQ